MVEYRILGPVTAIDDHGHEVDLGGLRERVLLARLLLSAGRVVPADTLAHDLWSGEPPPHSSATRPRPSSPSHRVTASPSSKPSSMRPVSPRWSKVPWPTWPRGAPRPRPRA